MQQDSVIFLVNSGDRLSGTTEDFTYQLQLPKGHNYDQVCVLQAMVPKSYYLIQNGFNTFTLNESGTLITITVVPGNYNALSWQTIIANLLNTASTHGWTYTCTYPVATTQPDTGMFTYTCTGGNPSFIFTSNIYEQMGFPANSTNSFVGGMLVSANVVKFQVEDILYIHSDISYNNDQSNTNDVLQEIYCSSTPNYSNVVYQNSGAVEAYSKKLLNANNNIYHFVLTNESGTTMNLNGLNLVMTILVYKKDNINEVLRKYMQLKLLKQQ